MEKKIKIVQVGMGPIGCSVARLAARKQNLEIVAAIDPFHPGVGKDIGELAEMGMKLGVPLSKDYDSVLGKTQPQVALHTTLSSLKEVYSQLETLIKAKVNIVSSCEELSYPFKKEPKLSAKIEKMAQENKVTVLGTGVNPGFLMDAWPLFMTGVCADVKEIKASRIQEASTRRIPFQKKIGAGKTKEEFNNLVAEGTLRHVGLAESVAMIAAGLHWELDDITESIEPIICDREVKSNYITVKPGQAAGVRQIGCGKKNGKTLITLTFEASIGAGESYDAVYITGTPNMEAIIKGGTHGDIATAAIIVNSVPKVYHAQPGLHTMKDLVIASLPNK
jgi:2,4-diaminopentanoate dehydrogenase